MLYILALYKENEHIWSAFDLQSIFCKFKFIKVIKLFGSQIRKKWLLEKMREKSEIKYEDLYYYFKITGHVWDILVLWLRS